MELGGVNSHPVRTAAAVADNDAAAELLALRQSWRLPMPRLRMLSQVWRRR